MNFTDLKSKYTLSVENSVLNYTQKQIKKADVSLVLSMQTMNRIQLKEITYEQAVKDGEIKIKGDEKVFDKFLGMLDTFNFWFNIVTP